MTKFSDDYSEYQTHPRFGRGPRITGLNPSDVPYDERVFLHWHSRCGVRIPNTAIAADTKRQAPATIHVTHYFDSKRVCCKCGAYFIFFAEEQRYWYEELQFPLEANLVTCITCRRHEHQLRDARQTYERLLSQVERSVEDSLQLIERGLFLVDEGLFSPKLLPKLRGFLNTIAQTADPRRRALLETLVALEQETEHPIS
jgi:hypothetical protein